MKQLSAIHYLKHLIPLNSVNPFRTVDVDGQTVGVGNEQTIAAYLEQCLWDSGFEVERQIVQPKVEIEGGSVVPERWNVVAQKGSGKNSLLLIGHMDTVDVKQGWDSDPFTPVEKIVDGRKRIYGLGACDMRAGLAAILHAAQYDVPEGVQLKIAFACDEEFWSFGAHHLVKSGFLSNVKLAIGPDVTTEASARADGQWVGLGKLGRSEFEISITGKATHGALALSDAGAVSALYQSARLAVLLENYAKSRKREFHKESAKVVNSIYLNNLHSGEGMLSVPDTAKLILDRTFLPDEDPATQVEELKSLIEDAQERGDLSPKAIFAVSPRKRPTPSCKPFYFSRDIRAVEELCKVIERTVHPVYYEIGNSIADENIIAAAGIPTIAVSPVGENYHCPNEWVDVESVERVALLLRATITATPEILA